MIQTLDKIFLNIFRYGKSVLTLKIVEFKVKLGRYLHIKNFAEFKKESVTSL